MSAAKRSKGAKKRILRWRGVMAESPRFVRWMVGIALAVASATFAFTQLGFVNVTLPDGSAGYIVVLMQGVALGALLLGTVPGVVLGLASGAIMLLHAKVLPLDHYELTFVTPTTSVIMFGVIGLLLGVLFAFVLRNDPGPVKRVVYISIVCIITSWLYSLGFAINTIISLAVSLFETAGASIPDSVVQQAATTTVVQMGNMSLQAWGTGLFMLLLCCVGDFVARKAQAYEGTLGLRSVFGSWLLVVVWLAFMAMAAASFGVSTGDALNYAEQDARDEVSYLQRQIQAFDQRARMLNQIHEQGNLDYDKVDEDLLYEASNLMEGSSVLDGYLVDEDGIVVIAVYNQIYASNDQRFNQGMDISEAFTSDALQAIETSIQTSSLQRFVLYDPSILRDGAELDAETLGEAAMQPQLAYVFAQDASEEINDPDGGKSSLEQKVILIRSSDQVFADRDNVMASMTLSSLVLLLVVFVLVAQLLNRVVARHIDEENEALARITAGDLSVRATAGGTREFESLTGGINDTVDALQGWIAEAESRMDAELATARAIQESALPRTFPPYPDILRFDVYASMSPAKQVGGDFYDFFLVGDACDNESGKVAFIVADVSGKGVPAALFMMRAKALLRDYVSSGMELGEAVTEANHQLIDGNDEGMFVTAWVGLLDYATGHVDYVNAGHNPPLLWNRAGGWQWIRQKSGPILGLFEVPYRAHAIECQAGDTFLLYTDGVTEAFDVNEKLYGEDRLFEVAKKGFLMHPRELLESVRDDVAAHAQGADQSDDITILALEVGVPPEITATIEVPALTTELNRVNDFLHAELDRRLCPQRVQNQLDIAVEELFVNVCHYAYPNATPDNPGVVRIQRTYNAEPQSIMVDIIDEGVPFDPLAKPDAVTPGNIEDVPIGGLGILMAKKCTDEIRYERTDGRNVVTVVKKW